MGRKNVVRIRGEKRHYLLRYNPINWNGFPKRRKEARMKDSISPDKKVILVIEDEAPLLEAIKRKLELSGSSVLAADTTEQALSYLQDEKRVYLIWKECRSRWSPYH